MTAATNESVAAGEACPRTLEEAADGILNPLGQRVLIEPRSFAPIEDPERLRLIPAALQALRAPDEVWAFPDEHEGTHQPHLRWTQFDGRAELVLAGTRLRAGSPELRTWFRVQDPLALLRRYRVQGQLLHPVRSYRITELPELDLLQVSPDPPCPYRMERFHEEATAFACIRSVGMPSTVGIEIHEARQLSCAIPRYLANLLSTPCDIGGSQGSLAGHLNLQTTRRPAT